MLCNRKKRLFGYLVILLSVIILSLFVINWNKLTVLAHTASEEKIYCTATIEDEFADDRIIITLNKNESKKLKDYTPEDFPEIELSSIQDLTFPVKEKLKDKSRLASQADTNLLLDEDVFHVILSLTLKDTGKQNVLNAIKTIEKRTEVICAEPDYIMSACVDPNDTNYLSGELWGLNGEYGIQAPGAWDISTGSISVQVGIIDTGIEANHEDLSSRVNSLLSHDFTDSDEFSTGALRDTQGHGTHVAGTIGAVGNNNAGICGVNWNVNLVSLKIRESGTIYNFVSKLVSAVNYATSNGIQILNSSNGYSKSGQPSVSLGEAIKAYSGLFVTSAGNKKINNDVYNYIPVSVSLPNVVSVGAIDKYGAQWVGSYSDGTNYGKKTVHIFAPGGGIMSTVPNSVTSSGYALWSGTSMAAPHVSGVAALLLSVDNTLTGAELKDIICATAVKQDNLSNYCVTGGRLNANKALKYVTKSTKISFYQEGGEGGTQSVVAHLDNELPFAIAPTKTGYKFMGYYSGRYGTGKQYYDSNMNGVVWDNEYSSMTLYAHWELKTCEIYISGADIGQTISLKYGEKIPETYAPVKSDHKFIGLFSDINGKGIQYARAELKREYGRYAMKMIGEIPWNNNGDGTLYAHFERMQMDFQITQKDDAYPSNVLGTYSQKLISGQNNVLTAPEYSGYEFVNWLYNDIAYEESTLTKEVRLHISETTGEVAIYHDTWGGDGNIEIIYSKKSCVAEGTLITLADGSQVPVESLTGDEMLLVWNLKTGSFDIAPILLIDKDPAREYKIINLSFSDGTSVKVISEHGFWDFDLNRYVYLDENAAEYLGHWFNKQYTEADGSFAYKKVQLTGVNITVEYTTAWSPETYGHLCYYVNGMLSMPGGSTGLFNIFEVDAETMRYDEEAFARDIELYGLFTYEEFNELLPVPEFVFEAYNGQYLKVAIGKGLITMEGLQQLAKRYLGFFE